MTTDNNTNPTESSNPDKESAMSILEKRLAEINAKKSGQPASPETSPAEPEPKPEATAPAAPQSAETAPENQTRPAASDKPDPAEAGFPVTEPVSTGSEPEKDLPAAQAPTTTTSTPEPAEARFPVTEPVSTGSEPEKDLPAAQAPTTTTSTPEPAEAGFPVTEPVQATPAAAIPQPEIPTGQTTPAPETTEGKLEAVTGEKVSLQDPVEATFVVSAVENFPTDTALHELTEEKQEPERKDLINEEIAIPAEPAAPATAAPSEPEAVAGPAEDESGEEETVTEEEDYSTLSARDLTQRLQQALKDPAAHKNSRKIFEMHRMYDQLLQSEKAEAQERFVAEGGTADDFAYRLSPEQHEIEKGMQQFRENRARDQRQEEEQKVKNLQRKNELIAQLRELVEGAESKNSVDKLKAIQAEWKATGPVPQAEAQQLWKSYHALLDIYYNNRSIFFELKELDRKRNYDAKLQLCERAEALVNEPSINKSLQELRHLHEEWKNIGPVPNDVKDTIWERFIQASEKVHQRKKEYLAGKQEAEQANLVKKQEILSRLEPFGNFSTDRINDWREKTDEIQKIKEEWDAVGLVPKDDADTINKKFWGTYKAFYQHKNQFFKSLDDQKMNNLKLKTELCEQAEALKDSTDWNGTKEKLIQLQKKWKTIGRVPDKYSEPVWQRFRAACNEFFDRKQNENKVREEELEKASAEKNQVCDELAERLKHATNNEPGTLEEFQSYLAKWEACSSDGGKVSPKIEERFNNLLEKYLDNIPDLSYHEKDDLLFQLQVNKLRTGPDANQKIHQKQQQIRREISQLENDIHTLKTNIEFFGRSKNAEKLREEYDGRIAEAQERISLLQKQLKAL